ncbi:MAG: hypothetical protein U1F43_14675 [Myxococcota bacterium]
MPPTYVLVVFARVAATLLMAAVPWLLRQLALPSVASEPLGGHAVSFADLGLSAVVACMCAVELGAEAVPRWRALRHGGPTERARLLRVTALLALLLAAWHAWLMADYLAAVGAIERGVGPRLLVMLELGAGLGATLLAARAISRWGLGNGLAVLVVSAEVASWVVRHGLAPGDAPAASGGLIGLFAGGGGDGQALIIALLAVGGTLVALRVRIGGARQPVAGLAPVVGLAWLVGALGLLELLGATDRSPLLVYVPTSALYAVAVLAVGGTAWWLTRGVERRARWQSTTLSVVFVLAQYVLDARLEGTGARRPLGLVEPSIFTVALGTALLADLVAEVRARLRLGPCGAVWSFHDVARADGAAERLAHAGIEHHLAGWRLRRLRRITAPWAPVRLLARPEDAGLAAQLARAEGSRALVDRALDALG